MIKILVYNKYEHRFPFTVKRKGHGNFQRSTRKTGGDAAAAFAGKSADKAKKRMVTRSPVTRKQENRQRKIPLGSSAARGVLRG